MEVEVFEGVEPDPSVETVMKGAKAMQAFEPDWIVSMGGGSPIDAAKAMWAFYEYPDTTFEELCIPFNFPELRQKAKFCAIPSTSGTATEVTAFSVITNYETGVKYPLADFNITPDVAIVDPDPVAGLPVKQVAYTGMDALTHAIEAYVSTLNCPFTASACTAGYRNGFRLSPGILQPQYGSKGANALRTMLKPVCHSPMHCLVLFTLWHKDRRSILYRTHSSRMRKCNLSSICHQI